MKSSKILDNCDFIALLRSSLHAPFTMQEQLLLDLEYDRFLARIERVVQGSKSKLEKLRILTRTGETLERLKLNIKDQTSSRYLYAQSAGSILDFEKRAILLQLKYPGLSEGTAVRKAPFRLSKKYTPTDLMEIITPLHAIGFFCLPDGSPASLADLTKEFETLCGIKFRNPETCRWAVLNRKNKLTYIVDTLRRTLLELSVK